MRRKRPQVSWRNTLLKYPVIDCDEKFALTMNFLRFSYLVSLVVSQRTDYAAYLSSHICIYWDLDTYESYKDESE